MTSKIKNMGRENICKISKCNLQSSVAGYCNRHYLQIKRHGKILNQFEPVSSLEGEIWKPIEELTGKYEISNYGRVKSMVYGRGNLLTPYFCKRKKELQVHCGAKKQHGPKTLFRVRTLVKKYFVPNPYNEFKIFHIDGDPHNCRADNLSYFGAYWHDRAIKMLRKQAKKNKDARDILDYMKGNDKALDRILTEQRPYLVKAIYYYMKIYRNNYGFKGNYTAEDIAQITLIKAINAIKKGLLRDATFIRQWLKIIARNTVINEGIKSNTTIPETILNEYGDELNIIDYNFQRGTVPDEYMIMYGHNQTVQGTSP